MAAPINTSNPLSASRAVTNRSEKSTPQTAQPGTLPFTRSAAEKPGGAHVNVDVNGFPTHLLFTNSNGDVQKIRRASQGAPEAPSAGPASSDVASSEPEPSANKAGDPSL